MKKIPKYIDLLNNYCRTVSEQRLLEMLEKREDRMNVSEQELEEMLEEIEKQESQHELKELKEFKERELKELNQIKKNPKEFIKLFIKNDLAYIVASRLWDELEGKTALMKINIKIAAIIYISFIKIKQPKTFENICDLLNVDDSLFNVNRFEIAKGYNKIRRILDIKHCKSEKMSMLGTSCLMQRTPIDFINNLDNLLIENKEKVKKDTLDILKKSEKMCSGRNPSFICAGAVFISCILNNEKNMGRKICELFGCTPETLTKSKRFLIDFLKLKIYN